MKTTETPAAGGTSQSRQVGGDHYTRMAIQTWDAMRAWMTSEEFLAYLRASAIKYLARAGKKGGPEKSLEDLRKGAHYLEAALEELGGSDLRHDNQLVATLHAWLEPAEFRGYLRGTAIECLAKAAGATCIEELGTAHAYLSALIAEYEKEGA